MYGTYRRDLLSKIVQNMCQLLRYLSLRTFILVHILVCGIAKYRKCHKIYGKKLKNTAQFT